MKRRLQSRCACVSACVGRSASETEGQAPRRAGLCPPLTSCPKGHVWADGGWESVPGQEGGLSTPQPRAACTGGRRNAPAATPSSTSRLTVRPSPSQRRRSPSPRKAPARRSRLEKGFRKHARSEGQVAGPLGCWWAGPAGEERWELCRAVLLGVREVETPPARFCFWPSPTPCGLS